MVRSAAAVQPRDGKVCLCIGFFDGVHLGHQQIIRQTVTDARIHEAEALVVTFDQHPSTVVRPDRAPLLIHPLEQRLKAIGAMGADSLLLVHFDRQFSQISGEDFIRALQRALGRIRSICVGATFVFGHNRSGNVSLLQKLGTEMGFAVHGLAAVSLDGEPVSSTRIREAIKAGNLDSAGQMLGRPFALCGPVVKGDAIGRTLGFPTANLDVSGLVLPPHGVYAVHAHVKGRTWRAVLNIGTRPTLKGAMELRVEAHLIDFEDEIYGEVVELTFVDKLRDEQKFSSLQELRNQIARDILEAQMRF